MSKHQGPLHSPVRTLSNFIIKIFHCFSWKRPQISSSFKLYKHRSVLEVESDIYEMFPHSSSIRNLLAACWRNTLSPVSAPGGPRCPHTEGFGIKSFSKPPALLKTVTSQVEGGTLPPRGCRACPCTFRDRIHKAALALWQLQFPKDPHGHGPPETAQPGEDWAVSCGFIVSGSWSGRLNKTELEACLVVDNILLKWILTWLCKKKNCLKSLQFRFGKWLEWKHGEHVRRLGDRLWHQNAQTHSGLASILYLGWALGKVT